MSEATMVVFMAICRMLPVLTLICGTIYLMSIDKPNWGWLLFAAVILGSYELTFRGGKNE